jgi:predicted nucleic acid-binding protein
VIVIDASAALDLLLRTDRAASLERFWTQSDQELHAPELIDLEVLQVLRRYARFNNWAASEAATRLESLAAFPIVRHAHGDLLARIWDLRDTLSAYDAAYVALAELLGATLMTSDQRLSRAVAGIVEVETFVAP